jgi:hypothetical protein
MSGRQANSLFLGFESEGGGRIDAARVGMKTPGRKASMSLGMAEFALGRWQAQ